MRKKYSAIEKELMQVMALNLRNILERKGTSQKELAEMTDLSTSAISDYINAKTLMSPGNVQIISSALKVQKKDIDPTFRGTVISATNEDTVILPVVGHISCGNGSIAYEEIEGYEVTPSSWVGGGEYFYLRAKGDSMNGARIFDGDLLLIRKQPEVEDGEIAAVIINDEAMLKRVYRNGEQMVLQSENPAYGPTFCPPGEATIIGKLKKIVINL